MYKVRLNLRKVVAIAICLAGITVFSGCKKDDPTEKPPIVDDVYIPPANLSLAEIVALILDAKEATFKIKRISIVTHEKIVDNNGEYQVDREDAFNAETKKFVITMYKDKQLQSLNYVEGDDCYYYSVSGSGVKEMQRPITNADQYYYCNDNGNWILEPSINATCKVENEKLIVIDTISIGIINVTYILNSAKQLKKMIVQIVNKDSDGNIRSTRDCERIYTYSTANPALPSGFNKGDFTNVQSDYYSIKVIWGEGKGENTFWLKQGNTFYLSTISSLNHAPEVTGKAIVEYTINGTTYPINSSIEITDNNTEITVVWGANLGVSQAKSTLLRNGSQIENMTDFN